MDAGPLPPSHEPTLVPAVGLREVLDSAPDLIFACDVAGTLLWVNAAVEELTGRARTDLIGQRFTSIVPSDEHQRILRLFRNERDRGASVISLETPIQVEGGSVAVIEARVRHVESAAGGGLYIGVGRLSESGAGGDGELEQRLAEVTKSLVEARAVAQLKADALATMTHEIRSPMNGILGLLHILLEGPLDPDQRGIVEILQNSSRTLLALMNDTLEFSRLESGKVELHRVDFDIVNTVHDIASLLGPIANEKGLGFECRVASGVPRLLHGDPGRLRQVIVNLATNAIKFTERGTVTMKVDSFGHHG
jgi:PAS domain S-box-containing protein